MQRDQIEQSAIKIIADLLERPRLNLKSVEGGARRDWLRPPGLESFQHLEPIGYGVNPEDWFIFLPEDCTPNVLWPINVGSVTEADEGPRLMTARSITTKEARGYARLFSPFMIHMSYGQIFDGTMCTASSLYSWIGKKWTEAEDRIIYTTTNPDTAIPDRTGVETGKTRLQPAVAIAIALRHRYEWGVSLGFDQSPSVRFATDPTGIKDIFRIRDLPEGKDRREALFTWVVQHWRQDRQDPETEIYVRKHLRGAINFNWKGFNCQILPSQFDIEQRDKLILERKMMRLDGTDRRIKYA
jgi:hypothetical protein